MALTQVKTGAIADDAVTGAKIADDTVAEANMANDAISLTELKAGTDGQIITYDASGNPVAVGPGTDGQVLTSTGAGSPPAFEAIPASVSLSGSTDNTVVTVTGANAMQGEANLKFDGTNLGIGTAPSHLLHVKKDTGSGAAGTKVVIENAATDSVNNNVELYLKTDAGDFGFKHYNATESYIQVPDQLIINTNTANSAAQAVHIDTSQNVKISGGDLFFGTAGKGIVLGATSNTDANTLDDYEEGTFTPKLGGNNNNSTYNVSGSGHYVKVGSFVHIQVRFHGVDLDQNADGTVIIYDMPFTGTSASTNPVCAAGTTTNFETYNINFDTGGRPCFYLSNNTTYWQGLQSVSGSAWSNWDIDNFNVQNVLYIDLTGTYRTT